MQNKINVFKKTLNSATEQLKLKRVGKKRYFIYQLMTIGI